MVKKSKRYKFTGVFNGAELISTCPTTGKKRFIDIPQKSVLRDHGVVGKTYSVDFSCEDAERLTFKTYKSTGRERIQGACNITLAKPLTPSVRKRSIFR